MPIDSLMQPGAFDPGAIAARVKQNLLMVDFHLLRSGMLRRVLTGREAPAQYDLTPSILVTGSCR
jgi:hypothetical protein